MVELLSPCQFRAQCLHLPFHRVQRVAAEEMGERAGQVEEVQETEMEERVTAVREMETAAPAMETAEAGRNLDEVFRSLVS